MVYVWEYGWAIQLKKNELHRLKNILKIILGRYHFDSPGTRLLY